LGWGIYTLNWAGVFTIQPGLGYLRFNLGYLHFNLGWGIYTLIWGIYIGTYGTGATKFDVSGVTVQV